MRACSDAQLPTDLLTDVEKYGGIFELLVRTSIKLNTDENYRQNLMPAQKILFYFSLVIPPEKLLYKTLPPFMIHFCSAPHFIFSSLLLSVCIKFLQEFLLFCW